MRWTFCLALLALSTGAAPPKRSALAGEWELTLRRHNYQPAVCRARLVLDQEGKRWTGHIQFQVILNRQRVPLKEIRVRSKSVEFALNHPRFEMHFEGRLRKDGLSGECDWRRLGRYPWSAARRKQESPGETVFVDPDLDFSGFFPKAKPQDAGVDAEALARLVAAAGRSDTDALIVLKDGKVVCDRSFGRARGRIHIMSVTKFVVSLAVAMLLDEGKIESLDAPVSIWFPEWKKGRKAKVTLRHLLAHTSGLKRFPNARALNEERDKVAFARGLPVVAEPGKETVYSNEGAALLSGILSQAAGQEVDAYLRKRLFSPLKIRDWGWDRDEAGHTIAYAQLGMTARDLARLGQLVLEGGRDLIRKETLAPFGRPGGGSDKRRGLLWRLYYDRSGGEVIGFGHTGWLGQQLVIYPRHGTVGVRLRRWKNAADAENPTYEFGAFASLLLDAVAR